MAGKKREVWYNMGTKKKKRDNRIWCIVVHHLVIAVLLHRANTIWDNNHANELLVQGLCSSR
jgi:hypothetical protein